MKNILSRVEDLLGMGPIPPDTPAEEVLCWLKAKLEDLEEGEAREDRAKGLIARSDLKLFLDVLRPYGDDTLLSDGFEILRRKKRRGHRQQKALDLWDQHYKGRDFFIELEPEKATKKAGNK